MPQKKKSSKPKSGKPKQASFVPPPTTALDAAQDIIYDAWESRDRRTRVRLAKQALEVSPDCADAYIILASETAKSLDEVIALLRKGMEAGERALGEDVFREDVGYFWGLVETRPYMRARAGLARALWQAGKRDEAIEHYQEMLKLNPDDNQGLRDILMSCLLQERRVDDAEALFKQYEDDGMATWAYSRVLIDFIKDDLPAAKKSLKEAVETNRHVVDYLLGKKKLPSKLPGYYGFGDENEAVYYACENVEIWCNTAAALQWLKANTK